MFEPEDPPQPDPQEQDFLARMSHELRTPLTAIQGYAELLLEGKPASHEDVPDLEAILRAAHRLQAFVDAVLDLNQLRMGQFKLRPEPFRLEDTVNDVQRAVLDQAKKHKTRLTLELEPMQVETDRRMIRQILFNLVDNAVRFTVNGEVLVRVRSLDPGRFELIVRDDGIGMTEAQVEACTTPFWQADASSTRRYDGAGMGLAVCRGLTEAMGGTLAIESRIGRGATVRVELPKVAQRIDEWDDLDEPTVFMR